MVSALLTAAPGSLAVWSACDLAYRYVSGIITSHAIIRPHRSTT